VLILVFLVFVFYFLFLLIIIWMGVTNSNPAPINAFFIIGLEYLVIKIFIIVEVKLLRVRGSYPLSRLHVRRGCLFLASLLRPDGSKRCHLTGNCRTVWIR
jgi:membrane protein YdbS with pleckstrin-like domain